MLRPSLNFFLWFGINLLLAIEMTSIGAVSTAQDFRTATELARLEASVVERGGRPVRGLTASDFVVEIDGAVQPILLLEEVTIQHPLADGTKVRSDLSTNDSGSARLFAIVLDDAQTPTDPFLVRTAKRSAVEVLRTLLPTDLVTVVYTWDIHKGQEFTTDHRKIEAAIERFRPGPSAPFAAIYAQRTLAGVLAALRALPAHQRTIVLLSPGVRPGRAENFARFGVFDTDADLDWSFEAENVVRATGVRNLAQVPIYAVDISGLVAPADLRTGLSRVTLDWATGADWLKTIAAESGGVAITRTNDPLPALRRAMEDTRHYYIVGFRPPALGGSHRIKLSVPTRKGATAVLRQYSTAGPGAPTSAPLSRAIGGFLPVSAVPVQMLTRVIPASNGTSHVLLGVRLQPPPDDGPLSKLNVEWRVFDAFKEVYSQRRVLGQDELTASGEDVTFFLRTGLAPGRYHVRVAVRGSSWRSAASVFGDVTVPKLGTDLYLSDIMMFSASRSPRSPATIADITPAVPNLDRVFSTGDVIQAVLAIHIPKPGSPHRLAIHVVGDDGTVLQSHDAAIPNRCDEVCGYSAPIGVERLPEGRYLLRVEIEVDGVKHVRESSFSLK